jgi:hypothetical protein
MQHYGLKIGTEKAKQLKEQRIKEYNLSSKICKNCLISIPYNKRKNNFCSQSCSATYNNIHRTTKRTKVNTFRNNKCLFCNSNFVKSHSRKFCNNKCQSEWNYLENIRLWKAGLKTWKTQKTNNQKLPDWVKRYLFEKYDSKCSECGWNKIHPVTGRVPLQIEHRDGNKYNNTEENLTLLCGSCHTLTPTYAGLNIGRYTSP